MAVIRVHNDTEKGILNNQQKLCTCPNDATSHLSESHYYLVMLTRASFPVETHGKIVPSEIAN
jgi:hypothetical protein